MSIIRNVDDTGYLFISVKKTKTKTKQPMLQQQFKNLDKQKKVVGMYKFAK